MATSRLDQAFYHGLPDFQVLHGVPQREGAVNTEGRCPLEAEPQKLQNISLLKIHAKEILL